MNDIPQMIREYLARKPDDCDQHERRVLNRIAADHRAHAAINAVTKSTDEIWHLVAICIDAEMVMRKFRVVLNEERDTVERLRRHRQSVEDLKNFLDQAAKWSEHPMVFWLAVSEQESTAYRDTLNRIAALIERRQQTAEEVALQLVVTRKSATKSAAETAAIGWLAEHVAHTFDKPFAQEVAILAEVALGIGEVSEDRVRAALKPRRRRKWNVDPTKKRLGNWCVQLLNIARTHQ
jgi:hypothetical protein